MNHGIYSFRHQLECTICTSAYADYDIISILTSCKHSFHKQCIDEWLREKRECPICRVKLFDSNLIKKIITMCTLNYFCNCLNTYQYNHARDDIMTTISAFIVDDTIMIDADLYRNKNRIELIDSINQLKTDVSRQLGISNDDRIMDYPLVGKYNDIIYDHPPFNEIVARYPTTSIVSTTYSWITELFQ